MSLLIDIRLPDWMEDAELARVLAPELPGVTIHSGPVNRILPDVVALATVRMLPGMAEMLPNLKLVQKLGAGVETMLTDPNLPKGVRVARLEPGEQAAEIAEWFLAYTLADLRRLRDYWADQARADWTGYRPRRAGDTSVAVLGLGFIGRQVAETFARNGFETLGWSRSPKDIPGVLCFAGEAGLAEVLPRADYIAAILPSTPGTRGLMRAETFAAMKPHAVLMNAGRGDLIDEAALLQALDAEVIGGAVLDVFDHEPLPGDHPFWQHPKVTITPHVAGWSLDSAIRDVAENYRRLIAGQPLLREIDREAGY